MKPYNGRTLVKVEKRLNDTIMVGGREFSLDPAFREYWHTVQMAEVLAADRGDIEPGDTVYVHHFINSPEQKLPLRGEMSFLEFNQIYAKKKDGKIVMLTSFVLVEPVTYEQAGLVTSSRGLLMSTHSPTDKVERVGIIRHLNPEARAFGYKEGDIILFSKNCEYEMLINDEVLYRMENRDIITSLDSLDQLKI